MKHLCFILCAFLLCACAREEASVNAANTAKDTIDIIYNELPAVCKTEDIKKLMNNAQAQIDTISLSCESEKDKLKSDIDKRNVIILALAGLLLLLGYRLIKRV